MSRQPFDPTTMPLDGIRLIEASAGTGKTFSLASLVVRLIVEQRLSVREILVITFTRAATQELRERIRQRLFDAARLARGPGVQDAASAEQQFAESVISNSPESREAIARRLAEAANRMDETTITTIHGFSQRAAAENAFDSALPFDRGEQVDDHVIFDEVVADYWRSQALGDEAETGFVEWWPYPGDLGESLRGFQHRPHAVLTGPANDDIEQLAEQVRKAWSNEGEDFKQGLRACWEQGHISRAQSRPNLFTTVEHLGGIERALAILEERLASELTIPALPAWLAHLNRPEQQFNKKYLQRDNAIIHWPLTQQLCQLQPLARLAALRKARSQVDAWAGARKAQRRQFSFNDMIAALSKAISDPRTGPRLAASLRATWPWALVDEFQDTDPLQYEILRRIYSRADTGGMIMIGDPKQAIYGFRGGDVFAYLEAARDAGEQVYNLRTNYRSTQGLLDAVEALFRVPGDGAFLVEGIDYQTVLAGRADDRSLFLDDQPSAPMTFWHFSRDKPRKDAAHAACRDACVQQIRKLLDRDRGAMIRDRTDATGAVTTRALAGPDIAVLVNKNREAAEMQQALSGIGIGAVCLHRTSVFAGPEADDVRRVLEAAASPEDEALVRAALATELLGYRLGQLIAMEDNTGRWQQALDRFQYAHSGWRGHGVLAMLQPMIQRGAGRLLTYPDGERRMSNYLQLAELLAEAETETFGMTGLLRWLADAMRRARQGETTEAEQLRLESDEALVRITTVHKAKGLEYPVVFLPFAPWLGAMGDPGKPPHAFHDDDNHTLIDTIGNSHNRAQAVREARAEALRVLYVALTRAELACFLPWGAANGTPDSALATLLHRADGVEPISWGGSRNVKPLTNADTHQRLAALAAKAPHAIRIEPLPEITSSHRRLPAADKNAGSARTDLPAPRAPWSFHSFTRLAHAGEPATGGASDETQPHEPANDSQNGKPDHPLPQLPGGVAFGSAVHELLEKTDFTAWPPPGTPLLAAQQRTIISTLRRHGVVLQAQQDQDRIIDQTAGMIQHTLHTPLPAVGALAALPNHRHVAEMEFMLRLRGQKLGALLAQLNTAGYASGLPREQQGHVLRGLMHGFIDLIVEHDGRFYVLDYKTNWLGDDAANYRNAALQQAVQQHHYDLQYLIYLTALHRYLGLRLPDYDPVHHLGGVLYLFMRGIALDAGARGVFYDRPDPGLIQQLHTLFDSKGQAA